MMKTLQSVIEKSEKTAAEEQTKRYLLFKKLTSHSIQQFRDVNINDFDLNITEQIQELQQIDTSITPLIYAAYYGLKDITKLLLTNKLVDVDQQTENNRQTPLITACLKGNYQIVRLLLISKAQVNKPNLLNQMPLTITLFRLVQQPITFENKKICFLISDLLIKNGGDLNWIIDKKNGYTLLHYFCNIKIKMNKNQKQLNYDIIQYLLQKGADYNMKTLGEKTCIDLLQNHCNKQQLILLFQKYTQNIKIQEQKYKIINKNYKKIDANFFKI